MKEFLMRFDNYIIKELSSDKLYEMIEFVVTQNYLHHIGNVKKDDIKEEINFLYQDELKLRDYSTYFVAETSSGEIIGAIRLLKWNSMAPFPLVKLFGPEIFYQTLNAYLGKFVWHVGRFAVKNGANTLDYKLFKILMTCVIKLICESSDGIMFAESDSKLFRTMVKMGIQAKQIGPPIKYLGSETIPICVTKDGLIDFYSNNIHLLGNSQPPQNSLSIPLLELKSI